MCAEIVRVWFCRTPLLELCYNILRDMSQRFPVTYLHEYSARIFYLYNSVMLLKKSHVLFFALIVLGYILYGLQYIQKTSIVVGDKTYYVLFDDAMISMRYAYNLAHGNGLVWNIGERVEGFTNPLWVGYMAFFHLFPIPLHTISLYIQLSGLIFTVGTLYFVRRIVEEFTDNVLTMSAAVAFTAFYSPLISWNLLGMEVSILTLILTAVLWIILRNGTSRFSPSIYILLAISTLVRMDMAVPFLVILLVLFVAQKEHRRLHLAWGLGTFVLALGGQTLARYLYYGDLLPNTYYLKVTGWPFALRILRGLYALIWFTYYSNWAFMLLPFSLLLFRRDWKINLLFLVFLGQVAYSVYVGGDAWENHGGANRYIALAMPIFFVLFAWTLQVLTDKAAASLGSGRGAIIGMRFVYIFLFAIAMLNFNLLLGDWKYIERWQFKRKPDYVAGNERNLFTALALQEITKPGASIAVVGAGTIPYLLPDRYAIDILGKTDPVIARGPVRTSMGIPDVPFMRPGHMKWNYAHTIGELQPDVIVSLWDETGEEATPYLENYVLASIGEKISVFLRKDSPNVLWDRVTIK